MAEQAFDWFAFQEAISDLGQYLNELKYVDDAYDFLTSDGQQQPWPLVEHELGRTAPFTVYSSPQPAGMVQETSGMDEVQEAAHLQQLANQAATWGYEKMADLRDRCDLVVKPVVEDYDLVGRAFEDLAHALKNDNAVAQGQIRWGLDMGAWEGRAADKFEMNFATPFTLMADNHELAVAQAGACVAAGRAVVVAGQNALMNLVVTARDKLKQQLQQRAARQRHAVISAEFVTVVGTGMSIVGTVVSLTGAGAVPGAALGVIGTGLGYAAGKIPEEDQTLAQLPIADAEESFSNLLLEVMQIRAAYLSNWNRIGYVASDIAADVADDESNGLLHPPRPAIDGAPPADMHHESSGQY